MSGTDVEAPPTGAELEKVGQELSDSIKGNINKRNLILPILKLGNQTTAEVKARKAEAGEYVNSLTGQNYGPELELVLAGYFEGRFWKDPETKQTYVSQSDTIPATWPHPDAGKPFADSLESEERWRERVNAGEIKWEGGPPISTTHNFIGFVVGEDESAPVRLSLMRTGVKAAKTILSLVSFERQVWDRTLKISSKQEQSVEGPYFVAAAERGDVTSPEQRQAAVDLAVGIRNAQAAGTVEYHGDEEEPDAPKGEAPKPKGDAVDID